MKLMILDGNSIVNRAFYGIRMLNAPDGTPTNAVYGFLTIFQRILELEQPQAVCVAFDVHAPTFRHEQYAPYKAQRKPMPEELVVQMPLLKQTLDHMGIRRLELAGWEADDLLGTVAKRCEAAGWACEIVTGDKDSLQLITDTTHVCHVKTRMGQTETIEYTPEVFRAEYGFDPIHMIDLKALMGDSSDNIPGVPGIGEKTAKDLLVRFGTVADIYRDLDTLDIKPGVRKKLTEGCESAQLSFDLATIRTDAPIDFAPESAVWDRDYRPELYDWFRRLGFLKLSEKWGLQPADGAAAPENALPPLPTVDVTDSAALHTLEQAVTAAPYVAVLAPEGLDALTLCDGKVTIPKGTVCILGGGEVACETAEMLMADARPNSFATTGSIGDVEVTLVEMQPQLMTGVCLPNRNIALASLRREGVKSYINSKVLEVTEHEVKIQHKDGTEEWLKGFDYIVLGLGSRKYDPLSEELKAFVPEVHVIGDAIKPGQSSDAMHQGFHVGYEL